MRSSKLWVVAVISSAAVTLSAAQIDLTDPRRATGREDDVRVDALLSQDGLSAVSPANITYQIENLSAETVAVADRVVGADYDPESQTITVAIGAEIPDGPTMPHMIAVKPGEKRILTCSVFMHVLLPSTRTPWTAMPRYLQIKVTFLRDVRPFATLIERQSQTAAPQLFPSALFDRWVDGSDSVFLNAFPVHWNAEARGMSAEFGRPPSSGRF